MINPRRHLSIVALIYFTTLGSACVEATDNNNSQNSGWQNYYDADSGFVFIYPNGWEVVDDFFYKTHYVATIQRIGGSKDPINWIRVNSPQFMENDGRCIEVDMQSLCTYSKDEAVLEIFEKFAASFKCEHPEENANKKINEAQYFGREEVK